MTTCSARWPGAYWVSTPDSAGGLNTYYSARAGLDVRLALAQERIARRLAWATWALVFATAGLIIVALTEGPSG
jgi:hypothetical protein